MRFELATARRNGKSSAHLFADGGYWPIAAMAARLGRADPGESVLALLSSWDRRFPELQSLIERRSECPDLKLAASEVEVETPVQWPGKVLCAGANYYDHMKEMGFPDVSKATQRLFFFFKPPRQALVGPGETVKMPRDTTAFDWEVELVAVIGRTADNVSVADALSHVAGYSVGIDLSARDLGRQPEQFYKIDWLSAKAHDTCAPVGPHLVPSAFVPDAMKLGLRLQVNGVRKQNGTTSGMIYDIAEQISVLSRTMTLEPGDLLFTGTPAGVGLPRQEFLQPGDRIDAAIEDIGALSVTIRKVR